MNTLNSPWDRGTIGKGKKRENEPMGLTTGPKKAWKKNRGRSSTLATKGLRKALTDFYPGSGEHGFRACLNQKYEVGMLFPLIESEEEIHSVEVQSSLADNPNLLLGTLVGTAPPLRDHCLTGGYRERAWVKQPELGGTDWKRI